MGSGVVMVCLQRRGKSSCINVSGVIGSKGKRYGCGETFLQILAEANSRAPLCLLHWREHVSPTRQEAVGRWGVAGADQATKRGMFTLKSVSLPALSWTDFLLLSLSGSWG